MIAGYTHGQGRRAAASARSSSASGAAASSSTPATSAPASPTRTIDELLAKLRPLERDDVAVRARCRRCRASARATSSGSSRSSSPRSSSPSGRTTASCARRRSRGCARTSRRRRCARRSRCRTRSGRASASLKLSNLDKVFWPDEGITKGDLLAYYRAVAPVLVPHLKDRPFTMRRYPDGASGKAFFQKDAPEHMPDWIPTARVQVSTARLAAEAALDPGAARQRRARAALDGEHGLHRHERVVLARRQARPARLRALRPRPVARRRLPRGRQVALLVKQALDALGLVSFPKTSGSTGCTCSSRSSGGTRTRTRASSPRSSPGARADAPRARHDGVVEGEAARRPDRLEPERRGQDDRVRLLGAAEAGRAGVDAAALGRGHRGSRPARLHDGDGARPRIERDGDLYEGVLTTRQRLADALRALR